MTTKIALSNQKGGVGKTTMTINVAGALAQRGHDVLVVDLDPQGHATEGTGLTPEYDSGEPHLGTALKEIENDGHMAAAIRETPEFDVIPSNIDMFTLESDLTGEIRSRERLALAFEEVEDDYNFIMIDCPPSLGHLTDNALLASQNVLIPALAEGTSIRALEILYDQIDTLTAGYGTDIEDIGLVANRVEEDGEATEMMDWFDDTLGGRIPIWEVRKRVTLKRAWNNGVSIFEHDEESDMESVFMDIAAHLEDI